MKRTMTKTIKSSDLVAIIESCKGAGVAEISLPGIKIVFGVHQARSEAPTIIHYSLPETPTSTNYNQSPEPQQASTYSDDLLMVEDPAAWEAKYVHGDSQG